MPRILFDASHNEYLRLGRWGSPYVDVDPERLDFQELALSVAKCGYDLSVLDAGSIPADLKNYCDIFVVADPESRFFHSWPVDLKKPDRGIFTEDEINNILLFVEQGGGLLIIQEKYGDSRRLNNLNAIVENFGVRFNDERIESINCYQDVRNWIVIEDLIKHDITNNVDKLIFFEGCSMDILDGSPLKAIAYTDISAHPSKAPVVAAGCINKGKVVCMGDATIFTEQGLGNICENSENHFHFLWNMLRWLTPIKGLSNNIIVTKSDDILLPICLNKIKELEACNSDLNKIINDVNLKIGITSNKIDLVSTEILNVKKGVNEIDADLNNDYRFTDVLSDIVLILPAFALSHALNGVFADTPLVSVIIILATTTILAVVIKIFKKPRKKKK